MNVDVLGEFCELDSFSLARTLVEVVEGAKVSRSFVVVCRLLFPQPLDVNRRFSIWGIPVPPVKMGVLNVPLFLKKSNITVERVD